MIILFFVLAFLSEVLGTIAGFGSSVFFVPISSLLFDFKTVLVMTSFLHIFSTSAQLFLFRKELNKQLLLKVGISSLVFVILGALLNGKVNLKYIQLIMGLFLTCFAIGLVQDEKFKLQPTTRNALVGGAISGFFAGLIGTGGAIRGLTLTAFDLPKGSFIGTSAAIDFFADLGRASIYIYSGYLNSAYYWHIPVLMLMAFLGSYVGKLLLEFVPQRIFRRFVLLMIFSSGLFMIFDFFSKKNG